MESIVSAIVALTTVIAVGIAVWELRENARISGQTHAREAWMRYLELGFHNPEYGSTELAIACLKLQSVSELWDKGSVESERYWWFLDVMMEATESLLRYFPEREWKNTIKYNLYLHRGALSYFWTDEEKFYSRELSDIVKQVCSGEQNAGLKFPYSRPLPAFSPQSEKSGKAGKP